MLTSTVRCLLTFPFLCFTYKKEQKLLKKLPKSVLLTGTIRCLLTQPFYILSFVTLYSRGLVIQFIPNKNSYNFPSLCNLRRKSQSDRQMNLFVRWWLTRCSRKSEEGCHHFLQAKLKDFNQFWGMIWAHDT